MYRSSSGHFLNQAYVYLILVDSLHVCPDEIVEQAENDDICLGCTSDLDIFYHRTVEGVLSQ